MYLINMARFQEEWVDWALEAMRDYTSEPDCGYEEKDIPTLRNRTLRVSPGPALDDMIDRLKNLAPDLIADNYGVSASARGRQIASLERLVETLETVKG